MSNEFTGGTDQRTNAGNEFCFNCEKTTEQVLITFNPDPNAAQREADDIPTDELQPVAGNLCCNCGRVITAVPTEATRSLRTGGGRDE